MVKQYPYHLYKLTTTGDVQDSNGDFIGGTSGWSEIGYCRDESASGVKLTGEDGVSYTCTFLVQCPKGTEPLKQGDEIKVLDGLLVQRLKGKVVFSEKSQLHTRIWV